MRRRGLRAVTTIGFGAVLLAAVGCTSGTTVSSATGTGRPPSSPAATSSPAVPSPAASSLSAAPSSVGQAADWPTYDRTAGRSGVSVSSPAPGAVRPSRTAAVDGAVYAQPLVVGSEVIVATENDSVYALDASSGAVRWSRHLAAPVTGGLPVLPWDLKPRPPTRVAR